MALAAAFAGCAFAANTVLTFSTSGTETYRDGTKPLDGECYALAWTDDAANFAVNPDGTATGGKLVLTSACAENGRCYPITIRMSETKAAEFAGGTWGVYLLDTRTTDAEGNVTLAGTIGNRANLVNAAILVADATVELANETFMSRTTLRSGNFLAAAGVVTDAAGLVAAIAAGGTVTLGADITLTDELVVTGNVTLNLGEYKITAASGKNAIRVDGGSLTITATTGGIAADGKYAVYTDYEVSPLAKSITIEGGVFEGGLQFNKYPIGTSVAQSGEAATPTTVTISGGTFKGHFGVYHAPTTIAGGTFEQGLDTGNDSRMVYSNSATPVVITGGTFSKEPVSVGSRVRVAAGYYEKIGGQYWFVIGDTSACEVKRNGKFYRYAADAFALIDSATVIEFLGDYTGAGVEVTLGEGQSLTVPNDFAGTVSAASGMTLAEPTYDTAAKTATYTVAANGVAKIDGTYYATLDEAFAAATSGKKITLVTDAELTGDLALAADVELALNGNAFTVASTASLDLSGGKLTISGAGNVYVNSPNCKYSTDTLVIKGGTYQFNPSAFRPATEDDYWRLDRFYVFAQSETGPWTVVPVPKAYVKKLNAADIDDFPLEAAYSFNAFTDEDFAIAMKFLTGTLSDPLEIARANEVMAEIMPFLGWNADFVVSIDKAMPASAVNLAGQYDTFSPKWLSFTEDAIAANQRIRLLGKFNGILTYQQICEDVRVFNCGAYRSEAGNAAMDGATMTVQLRLFDPNQDNLDPNDYSILICEYKYTFGGYAAKIVRGSETLRYATLAEAFAAVQANETIQLLNDYAGEAALDACQVAFTLDRNGFALAIDGSTNAENWYFEEMSNRNWFHYNKVPSTPAAPVVTVEVADETGETMSLSTLTPDAKWLDEKIQVGETAEEALAKVEENGLPAWQNYVIGQDPKAAVRVDTEQAPIAETPVENTLSEKVNVPANSGFTVKYELDQVRADGAVVKAGEQKDTAENFSIDLESATANTSGAAYFKLAAVIEAEDGTGAKAKVASENTIGVLKVDTTATTTMIAVPWTSLAAEDADISVANLVRTANLTEGDELHYYKDGKFKSWTLEDGAWKSTTNVSEGGTTEGEGADDVTVPRGGAVWLKRQNPTTPVYLVGEVTAEAASAGLEEAAEPGVDGKQSWNMVASPSVKAIDLNEQFTEPSAKDRIIVPTDGAPKNYTFKNGKWGYSTTEDVYKGGVKVGVRPIRITTDAAIKAGTGFWYLNAGEAKDVEWAEPPASNGLTDDDGDGNYQQVVSDDDEESEDDGR